MVGHGVTFVTAIHSIGDRRRRAGPVTPGRITVGDGAWIGANATILPNVSIGVGAVIAAGSLVNRDVPPDSLYGGVPARRMRDLTS